MLRPSVDASNRTPSCFFHAQHVPFSRSKGPSSSGGSGGGGGGFGGGGSSGGSPRGELVPPPSSPAPAPGPAAPTPFPSENKKFPRLAHSKLFWRAAVVSLVLAATNPGTVGRQLWETSPTMRCLMQVGDPFLCFPAGVAGCVGGCEETVGNQSHFSNFSC